MCSRKPGGGRTNVSASTGLGFTMGMLPAELAVGLFAVFRFTGIIDSGVVL